MVHSKMIDAAKKGDLEAIRESALEDPSSVDANENGIPVVLLAAYYGRREAVVLLVELGAAINFWTGCAIGHEPAVRAGLPDNADVLSADGFLPLCLAVAFRHAALARLLLAADADPNARSESLGGVAPIHSAVFGRDFDCVRLLVEAGADLDAAQEGGFTPVHAAAQNGDFEIVKLLVERGCDPHRKTPEGKTPADLAGDAAHPEVRAYLLDHGG